MNCYHTTYYRLLIDGISTESAIKQAVIQSKAFDVLVCNFLCISWIDCVLCTFLKSKMLINNTTTNNKANVNLHLYSAAKPVCDSYYRYSKVGLPCAQQPLFYLYFMLLLQQ